MIYFVILFLLVILAIRYDIQGKIKYRDKWYYAVLIILILVAGLRWRFATDSVRYMYMFYYDTPYLWDLTGETFLKSGQPPLWILLNSIVKSLGGRFFVVQLIQASIVDVLFLKYFKKHSPYPFACVVLFFFWRYQYFNMMILKAATALSILMFSNDYLLEKKYMKWFILVIIAIGFHQSSALLLLTPFMLFLRFNKIGVAVLVGTYFVGVILQGMLGDFFEMLEFAEGVSRKVDVYLTNEDFTGQTKNLNYFIVRVFPVIIYPVLSLVYVKYKCKDSHILRLEPFVMMGLVMQMMQFNIHIFYRFTYIYYVYYIIFITHFFIEFSRRSFRLEKALAYTRTFIVVFPFLACIYYAYLPFTTMYYNPYNSVIERSMDKNREKWYKSQDIIPTLDKNKY
jgi:hypothetical protein